MPHSGYFREHVWPYVEKALHHLSVDFISNDIHMCWVMVLYEPVLFCRPLDFIIGQMLYPATRARDKTSQKDQDTQNSHFFSFKPNCWCHMEKNDQLQINTSIYSNWKPTLSVYSYIW